MPTGKGSYGSVYEARKKDSDERVAIKVIPVGDNDEIEDIQKEIGMLKECHHPNVVQYLVSRLTAALQSVCEKAIFAGMPSIALHACP